MDWIDELAQGWENDFPQLDVSSLPALLRLARLAVLIDAFQSDVLEPFELTQSDYDVLARHGDSLSRTVFSAPSPQHPIVC